jgi:hypothetical protein
MPRAVGIASIVVSGIFAVAPTAIAQSKPDRPTFGLYGGLNLATFGGSDVKDAESKAGFLAGVSALWNFSGRWGFQPSVEYTQKGASAKSTDNGTTVGVEARISYFEVPLLLRVTADKMQGTTPYFVFGPSFAFKSDCTVDLTSGTVKLSQSCSALSGKVNSFDYGAMAGVGADFKIGSMTWTLAARYTLGLADLGPDTDAKNRVFNFLAGVNW